MGHLNTSIAHNFQSRKSMPPEEFLSSLLSAQEAWKTEPDHFPFSSLTRELQIRIFTYLNPAERGSIAVVCKKWNSLIRHGQVFYLC